MRYGGLSLFIERAADRIGDPRIERHKRAIVLGSVREDLSYLPILDLCFEHLSLSHFYKAPLPGGFFPLLWPGARSAARRYFGRAVREHEAGRVASAFVQLGRATHLVVDMACPVHVHRHLHDNDLFEWWVDTHAEELGALPLPEVPRCAGPEEVIERLSAFTAGFRGDPSQHYLGRILKKRGILRGVGKEEIAAQARAIVPVGCAYVAELFRLFLERIGSSAEPPHRVS